MEQKGHPGVQLPVQDLHMLSTDGGRCASSTSQTEQANLDKAGKELLVSIFSAVWGHTTTAGKRQSNFNNFSFLQSLKCKLLGKERDGLVEELLALKHSMKCYNQRVENLKHGILHYKMIQSMSRLTGLPEPPVITKVNLQERDVSLV